MTTNANSAASADLLSSEIGVSTSLAGASQMPRDGTEFGRVPAISKARAGGHCVTRRAAMNLIVSGAAVLAAGIVSSNDPVEAACLNPADDEIFRLIDEHKRANAEFAFAISDANLPRGHYSGLEEEAHLRC